MDSGDRPTCSKYWRQPDPEPYEEEPEPEPESPDDGAPSQEVAEPSQWQLNLPATILREMGNVLQIAEVKNARLVCKLWTTSLEKKLLQNSRRFAVNATSYQWEPIHYSHALYTPRIFPRMFHCGAHHPMTDKIYMFGGNGPQRHVDNYDFDAHFNDVWTYDMRQKRWDRLVVPGTPYPTPKSRSSLVVWKEYLVLFGGFRRPNRRERRTGIGAAQYPDRISSDSDSEDEDGLDLGTDRGFLPHEVHYLNVRKNVWETATPIPREGSGHPNTLGIHDHGVAVYGKWMVVVGGLRSTPWEESVCINTQVFLFDLEERIWHRAPLPPDTFEEKLNMPRVAEFARGSLTFIRPGRFLFHPCFPIRYPPFHPQHPNGQPGPLFPVQVLMARERDTLGCYFLDFNPERMMNETWRWRAIPVVSPHILRQTGPLAAPVAVTCDNRVRLVTAVMETRRVRSPSDLVFYNGLQALVARIKGEIHTRIHNSTPAEFYESLTHTPFEFELDCAGLYKHIDIAESGVEALRLIVSVLQGKSGHIGDYKVCIRFLDARYVHIFTRGVVNFIDETTVGHLPTKGGGRSPLAASTEKTLQMVRQSSRRIIRLIKADLTALDEQSLQLQQPDDSPRLVWEETEERPAHEEHPLPSAGLLMVQADGTLFVTGGESRPDEDGVIDTSIGGGTWVANPVK
ncbi:hypothetical protein PENTCL1PPCAC_10337 [Pristionchus entomophagus]|uniref:F-box domain-containing protein n=1 Tax=Pristionchus entomophagus TaxID=358040 RepID=A0AAV5SZL8_9BILA|nr:hypothetical protein PENTCL1PPCAC_10337 [Pristionchus entomophagus]